MIHRLSLRTVSPIALVVALSGCANSDLQDIDPFGQSIYSTLPVRSAPAKQPLPAVSPLMPSPAATSFPQPEEDLPWALSTTDTTALAEPPDDQINEAIRLGQLGYTTEQVELLQVAGATGKAQAYYLLAELYQKGLIGPDDEAMAAYLNKAHEMGHVEASRVLGHLHLLGKGVVQDEQIGRSLLASASKESTRAAREYGLLLSNLREPHLSDMPAGISYLEMAAQRGDTAAAKSLHHLYSQGMKPPAPHEALAQGADSSAEAQVEAPTPSSEAADLIALAMAGDATAAFQLGQKILMRHIPDPSPEFTGYCWVSVAATFGLPEAQAELPLLSGIRAISNTAVPGSIDKCISDLHYQITGQHESQLSATTGVR